MDMADSAVPLERRIWLIRGQRVMLDRDLAEIYHVSTGRLNEQVKRNRRRFPEDFMFQLTRKEMADWISQNAISNSWAKMGLRKPPHAFTEHGAVMLAAVLKSDVAVDASIRVVRAFNRFRRIALAHRDLRIALAELARKVQGHDGQLQTVFAALRRLMRAPAGPRKKIGFTPQPEE